jgi:lysozyme family protein
MMADYIKAFKTLVDAEYSERPHKFLHINRKESGLTLGGIYEVANPETFDWDFAKSIFRACDGDIERASVMLYNDSKTKETVFWFFKKHYWDISRLSEIHDQNMAEEIFLMSVVTHPITAVKLAQRLVRTEDDGIVGVNTLKCLNNYNPTLFDRQYDNYEQKHFAKLIANNPELSINEKGWHRRSLLV